MHTTIRLTPGRALAAGLGIALCLSPVASRAQTLDSGVGIGPSQQLSTPPQTDPINRPGAMRRAVAQRNQDAARARRATPAPAGTMSPK